MMAENPKVFISYSHDSPEHKQWVSELAARLRRNGIDAILDQWDLGLGDDVTQFMERGIVNTDRVLVICTDEYVSKANAAKGGVGYERMIVTTQLMEDLGTDKFIPIIRQASGKEKMPTFLGRRVYADFTNDSQFDVECEKLICELHEMPIVEKPPLGKSPFPSVESDAQLTEIPEEVKSPLVAYTTASKLVRAGDTLGWRQLVKQIRPNVFKTLVQWRQNELDRQQPKSKEQLVQVVDKAVDIISPLMCMALVGVESGREEFKDQKSLLDDLQNIVEWNPAGYEAWIRLPNALGYVYHSLHGGISLSTNQIDLALDLARAKIPVAGGTKFFHLWEMGEFIGYA
ncbi:MAG: toll/interleukin-1 receptor domain-containing protein, partial [Candidatus Poribacteria bacterium]|nr:toll/interleukin-1 receptor domain-containing protein [Candidatus Poribacteria bacterium]